MCDDIIVDLKDRDGDLLFSDKKPFLSVADLKQVIQMQKVCERDVLEQCSEISKFYGVGRPLPNYCVPALVQPVFGHEIF